MASVVDICNLALSLLGKQNIASLSEETTEARACQQFYAHARDSLLSTYPWGFATRQVNLAQIANDKAGTWAHAYALPVDALRLVMVRPPYAQDFAIYEDGLAALPAFGWHAEGGKIYSHIDKAVLVYTGREENVAIYPALFAQALAYDLAVLMALPMTNSMELQGRLVQLAERARAAAQAGDAGQNLHWVGERNDFIRARGEY